MEDVISKISEKYITRRKEFFVEKYLGIIIEKVDNGICLHSKPYIIRLLENYDTKNCRPSPTVLHSGLAVNRTVIENYNYDSNSENFRTENWLEHYYFCQILRGLTFHSL